MTLHGRPSVSKYDDPSWYEQPEKQDNDPLDDLSSSATAGNDASSQEQTSMRSSIAEPQPSRDKRWHIFGQPVRRLIVIAALLIIAFLAGWFSHQAATGSFNPSDQSQSYANLIQQAWTIIDQNYVDRKAIDYKLMSYDAIQAMLAVLKDTGHTRFLTPTDVQSENQDLSGMFVGVGISIAQDTKSKQFIIASVIPGSPAEKAGLKRGDIIIAVNGTSTASKDLDTVRSVIHNGNAGTTVSITVKRPPTNQTLTIKVTRAAFNIPNVIMHYIAPDHIAQI